MSTANINAVSKLRGPPVAIMACVEAWDGIITCQLIPQKAGRTMFFAHQYSINKEQKMAMTFMKMVEDAMGQVDGVSADEAQQRAQQDPETVIVDVRDAADVSSTGLASGALNISLGMLPIRADTELPEDWREPKLQDRSCQVITTCQMGPNAAIAAKTLKDMGFTNVSYMEGGMEAWKAGGHPTD